MLIGHYFITLPDSTADAVSFERISWYLAQLGFSYLVFDYNILPSSKFITWVISIPYSLFGRSILMAQSISLLFGMGNVFLGWKVAKMIWDERIANKVGWTIALFPSLVLYSVLVLREVYVAFFLLVALYGVVKWVKTNSYKSLMISIFGFIGATYFHGAMMLGGLAFLFIVFMLSIKKSYKLLLKIRISLKMIIFLSIFIFLLGYYVNSDFYIPYLGTFEDTSDISYLLRKANNATRGVASFPEWLKIFTPVEFFYKGPVRMIYFLFSPFPWDVKQPQHLIGLIDSFLYIYLIFLIFYNRKVIFESKVLKIILLILISYIVIFSIGVGNFGTGIRHRTKFTVFFILLAAPLLKKLTFFKKE